MPSLGLGFKVKGDTTLHLAGPVGCFGERVYEGLGHVALQIKGLMC